MDNGKLNKNLTTGGRRLEKMLHSYRKYAKLRKKKENKGRLIKIGERGRCSTDI